MAFGADRRSKFFFNPPAHLCAVTYEYIKQLVKVKFEKIHGKFGKTGLNNMSISKFQKVTEPDVRKSKRSLLACHIRCECSIETSRNINSAKVKIGIMVIIFMKSLIG